jgi:hypothetical protein
VLPFVVAAGVAVVVGGIEQANRLRSPFTLRNHAVYWWGWRLLLEAAVGVVAIAAIRASDQSLGEHVLTWIGAGAVAGPAVARLRIVDLEKKPVGLATAYEPARAFIESRLDKRSAEELTIWLNVRMLPRLRRANPPPRDLAQYVIDYLGTLGTDNMPPNQARSETEWIEGVRDGPLDVAVQLETLARHAAIELRAFRLVERYVNQVEPEGAPHPIRAMASHIARQLRLTH